MSEGIPSREHARLISNEEVVAALRANPEDFSVLTSFVNAKEATATTPDDTLRINIQVAHLYKEAGLTEEAYNAFVDAAIQAQNQGKYELYRELVTQLDTFDT